MLIDAAMEFKFIMRLDIHPFCWWRPVSAKQGAVVFYTRQHTRTSTHIYVSFRRIPSHLPYRHSIFWDKGIVNGGNHLPLYGDKTSNFIIRSIGTADAASHIHKLRHHTSHRSLLMRNSANLSRGHDNANSGWDSAGNCNQAIVRRCRFEVLISQ